MKKKYIIISMFMLALNVNGQMSFSEISGTTFPALVDGEAVFSDLDNDNDLDILLSGGGTLDMMTMSNTPTTVFYKNDGIGNFTFVNNCIIDSLTNSSISIADIDNDNDNDIFINGKNSSNTYVSKIYFNNGSGVFTLSPNSITGFIQGDSEFGDIDGDNDADLVITGYSNSGYFSEIYKNNGTGVFTLFDGTTLHGGNYASVKFIDIEKDNDLDIIVSGDDGSSSFTKLYSNNASGVYSLVSSTPFRGCYLGAIDIADIDSDNDYDVVIAGFDGTSEFTELYSNNGSGTFTLNSNSTFTGVAYASAQFADFDIDGDNDLIISGYNGTTTSRQTLLYSNNGSGVYSIVNSMPFANTQQFKNIAGDIDGDSDPDFYLSGSTNGSGPDNAKLYRNDRTALSVFQNEKINELEVFPNPNNGTFNLTFKQTQEFSSIKITSLSGQIVKETKIDNSNTILIELNESKGMYLMHVTDSKGISTVQKIIVE